MTCNSNTSKGAVERHSLLSCQLRIYECSDPTRQHLPLFPITKTVILVM